MQAPTVVETARPTSQWPGAGEAHWAFQRSFKRLGHHWLGLLGLLVVVMACASALLAPYIAPYDPFQMDLKARFVPPAGRTADDALHLLGTDSIGRDLLSRILHGSRISLLVGFLAVAIAAPLGILLGLLSGYFEGIFDRVVAILVDIQMAIPFIIFAIALIAIIGPSTVSVITVIGLVNWVVYARVTRAQVISLKHHEFVVAAHSIGCGFPRILLRHLLPNVVSPLIVIATFQLAQAILLESSMSFLGAGIPPPTPTWGGMLNEGKEHLSTAWWLTSFPGLALAATVLGINLMGDWLRDILDPTLKGV